MKLVIKNIALWEVLKLCKAINTQTIVEGSFFNRSTIEAAELTLGLILCRQFSDGTISRNIISEVEAYDGPEDKACHAHKGLTPRTEIMFGPSGYWYVYLCYGVHWMLNVVTGDKGYPAAILIRGTESINGPGRLTKKLQIDQSFNKLNIHPCSKLWIEYNCMPKDFKIERTARIGVDYAGPIWAKKPYRFLLKNLS